jgi:SAM-dependent methyltransferase
MTSAQAVAAELLICPVCHGSLRWTDGGSVCEPAGHGFRLEDGISVMLADEAIAEHDEMDHLHHHKKQQAAYFDEHEAAEYEITRPNGTPAFYQWLLQEKMRRSVVALRGPLNNARVLTVCGGSGMDAEFLARAGARVITSDISLGACKRAAERARRYRLDITSVAADVEHLPFPDRSFDLVYVHDGLHHLDEPRVGLREMARVSAGAVSITEPAKAAITAVAVRFGLALEREEAGNRVARLSIDDIVRNLKAEGFRILHAGRYGMFYRHEPGRISGLLSTNAVIHLAQGGFQVANKIAGRFGNKVTVQAIRA